MRPRHEGGVAAAEPANISSMAIMTQGRKRRFYRNLCSSGVALIALWWIVTAGPVTVYRTIAYNFSGIDDHRIFPRRILTAASNPARFREDAGRFDGPWRANLGAPYDRPLADLLRSTDTTAFLIVKDNAVVFEQYAGGHGRAIPSLSFSLAKSVLSILIGCAIDDGYIESVEQPVADFVPELREHGFDAVTLKHLLQMTSGIDYAENDFPLGIHPRFYYTNRLEHEILELRLGERPGSRFDYKSGDAYLLTLALKRALHGKSITEYTQERLWTPLGMEYDGSWSIDHAPDGLEKTACCLAATARDFAKLGQLYLNKGLWQGRRIVSADWVENLTREDAGSGNEWEYRYLWWKVARNRPDFIATGHLGQFLYVNPATKVVIVRLGKGLGKLDTREWKNLFLLLSGEAG